MIKQKQFSFTRFGMLFKKHTVENFRNYAISLFVMVGIMLLIMGMVNYKAFKPMEEKQQLAFFLGFLLAAGTIFTSNIFTNLGEKRKAIASITLPASSLEKFLVGWLYSFVIFQIIFIAVFYAIVATILKLGNWPPDTDPIINVFEFGPDKTWIVFIVYAFLHSTMIYGAIFFKKMHFIKTAFAFFIILIAIWLLNDQVLELMIHQPIHGNPPFGGLNFAYDVVVKSHGVVVDRHHQYDGHVDLPDATFKWILLLFSLLGVMMWGAAYYKLKEKKV